MSRPDEPPLTKFYRELMSVFIRWHEESDLDEFDMEAAALQVLDDFCGKTVEFEADSDFLDELDSS